MPLPSVTWSTLKSEIGLRLNDTAHSKYSATLLLTLVNDALRHFASVHTGLASDFTITGDGTTYTFDLPQNIVDTETAGVFSVQWTDQEWIAEDRYWQNRKFPSTSRDTSSQPLRYILWPVQQISFTRVPGNGDAVIAHYVAYYPDVIDDTSVINVPVWAREAIKCYVCAEALAPGAVKASQLRQYQSRREAGNPEDNPLQRQSESFAKQYYQRLAEHRPPMYKHDVSPESYR